MCLASNDSETSVDNKTPDYRWVRIDEAAATRAGQGGDL